MIVAEVLLLMVLGVVLAGVVVAARRRDDRAAERVHRALERLEPQAIAPEPGLDAALDRLERVTERRSAERERDRLEIARLRAALDGLPYGLVVAGPSGEILARNAAAVNFVGTHHADVIVDDAVTSLLHAALLGELGLRTLPLFGPPRRTIEVRSQPVIGDDDTLAGALVLIDDVTERARLEAVRTDFVANISHELKTPVGAVSLLAETLIGEDDPELVAHLAERVVKESHRVSRIIDDLLELSSIESGQHLARQPVDVGHVLAEAADRIHPLAHQRRIRIELIEAEEHLSVVGDRRQLVSAVANLVENAVKYSETGSEVEVGARRDGEHLEIAVTDHGIGIPSRDLDRIFERFYRVDRARSRETGGTGLGLAIVRHVVANHAGTVTVQSVEGEGSTFTLRLPCGQPPVTASVAQAG